MIVWRGIFKVLEEAGELIQDLAKLGPYPVKKHPDGKGELLHRVEDEIADMYAALDYFVEVNNLNRVKLAARKNTKLALYKAWILSGIDSENEQN